MFIAPYFLAKRSNPVIMTKFFLSMIPIMGICYMADSLAPGSLGIKDRWGKIFGKWDSHAEDFSYLMGLDFIAGTVWYTVLWTLP